MKHVLVVDDEPKIVYVVRDYLVAAGFTVTTAADGPSALESARSRLLLADRNMTHVTSVGVRLLTGRDHFGASTVLRTTPSWSRRWARSQCSLGGCP